MPEENAPGFIFRRPDRQTNNHGYPTRRYLDALATFRGTWTLVGIVTIAALVGLGAGNGEKLEAAFAAAFDAWSHTD